MVVTLPDPTHRIWKGPMKSWSVVYWNYVVAKNPYQSPPWNYGMVCAAVGLQGLSIAESHFWAQTCSQRQYQPSLADMWLWPHISINKHLIKSLKKCQPEKRGLNTGNGGPTLVSNPKKDRSCPPSANQVVSSTDPRCSHAVCTLRCTTHLPVSRPFYWSISKGHCWKWHHKAESLMTLIGTMGLKGLTACRGYSVSLLQYQSYKFYIQLWASAIAPYHMDVFTQTNLHFYTYNYKAPALWSCVTRPSPLVGGVWAQG